MGLNRYVSDCCLSEYKLKTFYNADGSIAMDVALRPGEGEAECMKCGQDCNVINRRIN